MPSQIPQDDLTFDEAMNTVCPECGDKAQIHRLTRTGTLYCLGYNKEAQKKKRWFAARRPIDVYFTPVKNLVRSPLSKEVGAVIDYNLHSSLNAGILLF